MSNGFRDHQEGDGIGRIARRHLVACDGQVGSVYDGAGIGITIAIDVGRTSGCEVIERELRVELAAALVDNDQCEHIVTCALGSVDAETRLIIARCRNAGITKLAARVVIVAIEAEGKGPWLILLWRCTQRCQVYPFTSKDTQHIGLGQCPVDMLHTTPIVLANGKFCAWIVLLHPGTHAWN